MTTLKNFETPVADYSVVNGKKLTKTEQKLIAKYLKMGTQPGQCRNRFSGRTHVMEPLAVAIFNFTEWFSSEYDISNVKPNGVTVREYDTLRMLFLKLWPSEYMDLLD